MNSHNKLDIYDDPVHGVWGDLGYNNSTGDLSEIFDDTNIDQLIGNLNYWD